MRSEVLLVLLASCGAVPASRDAGAVDPVARARIEPAGEIPHAPLRYEFPATEGEGRYRVRIRDRAGREVASVGGPASPLILPGSMADLFTRGEPYEWSVEVEDARGRVIATRPGATFTIRPAP